MTLPSFTDPNPLGYRPPPPWTEWEQLDVFAVTDGDTLRGWRLRDVEVIGDGLVRATGDSRIVFPRGVSLRLVHIDTPEKADPAAYGRATEDLSDWIFAHRGRLSVATQPGGGFDRYLADVYITGQRGMTASSYMLTEGWGPYLTGKQRSALRNTTQPQS